MKNSKFQPVATVCLVMLLGLAPSSSGWAGSIGDKVKGWIEEGSEAIQKGVDELGDDFASIQDYLDQYHWKGIIQDTAGSGSATLKQLKLNEHSRVIIVKPGEKIEAKAKCNVDADTSSAFSLYRIVVGLKGVGPQAVIGNELGFYAGKTREKFTLVAPEEPGMYQIRFRLVEAFSKTTALNAWTDAEGNEPDGLTTIGIIFVKN